MPRINSQNENTIFNIQNLDFPLLRSNIEAKLTEFNLSVILLAHYVLSASYYIPERLIIVVC